mmetsp:Transcript_35044/g.60333  ORF Transcript_35044/g.60333 Transcript_35044/m.60333 type:complete len:102 (-) Transcript_35044:312-617(-)
MALLSVCLAKMDDVILLPSTFVFCATWILSGCISSIIAYILSMKLTSIFGPSQNEMFIAQDLAKCDFTSFESCGISPEFISLQSDVGKKISESDLSKLGKA